LDRLQNYLTNFSDFKKGGETLAYAAYVLARAGRANIGDLRYFADAQAGTFSTPLAGAHLAAALAMLGDQMRAEKLFVTAVQGLSAEQADVSRADFGSALRDRAGVLTLVAETGLQKSAIPAIARSLATTAAQKSRTSTQENAWLLRAANALFTEPRNLSLTLNGKPQKGAVFESFSAADLQRTPIRIANAGDAAVTAMVTISGAPITPEPAEAKGFLIERSYYTMDGKPRGLEDIVQNERLVVVLRVNEVDARRGRILLVDHLPAGFEIENPRLSDAGSGQRFSWLANTNTPEHSEYRNDRFVAAFNRDGKKPEILTVSYVVRAVTPGRYAHPPATVEDMYRPGLFARTASGTLKIAAPGR
ncbi:MAG: alpha-2-macroglobulin family protein, partial [Alphaproteobacteria bacterium]